MGDYPMFSRLAWLTQDIITPDVSVPTIPWGLIGGAFIVALFGLSLWRTTVGKILIIGAIVLALVGLFK